MCISDSSSLLISSDSIQNVFANRVLLCTYHLISYLMKGQPVGTIRDSCFAFQSSLR